MLRLILMLLASALLNACTLPPLPIRTESSALADASHTVLGRAIRPQLEAHPDLSGLYPLTEARDAFTSRALLAESAERTLDVQYYIWHGDITGGLLFQELLAAADRGVHVRLLLDDNNTDGMDTRLALLDVHPNIEVRLFNPFLPRQMRYLSYLADFRRLNRRMHNKSFIADNAVCIVGGRNVGDEYFDATQSTLFTDLDVLAIGPIVQEVSASFDRYWASALSYPVHGLLAELAPTDAQAQRQADTALLQSPEAQEYLDAIRASPFRAQMLKASLPLMWARTVLVSDDPAKAQGQVASGMLLLDRVRALVGEPRQELDLVSPYFVPSTRAVNEFEQLAANGVAIRILTNSLEATDVMAVHAGYAKWRPELLRAGIVLYELKREGPPVERQARASHRGASASSLHAKTFAVDHRYVFVGSFNFDQRSAYINTEMGLMIDSPQLALEIEKAFVQRIPLRAYRVSLGVDGNLRWTELKQEGEPGKPGTALVYTAEPGVSLWRKAIVRILSLLPLDGLL